MALAGFSAGEAEGLRRAMSKARHPDSLKPYASKFVAGAMAKGASQEVAERIFEQVVGFSGFGFPKAHSAAFGLLAYQSAWLRVHYGPEFLCGLLNEQPMGFYPPDSLVHEAQRRGIPVLPPSVVSSKAECSVEPWRAGPVRRQALHDSPSGRDREVPIAATRPMGVRVGLGYVGGVGEEDVRRVVDERARAAFRSLADLASRCGAQRDALERLAWAGACDELAGGDRRR